MDEWTQIDSAEGAEALLRQFGGFHDSCLVGLSYQNGAYVDEGGGMHFGGPEDRALRMVFHSQWTKSALELCFTGVKRVFIVGWQERYFCDIFDCHLALHRDLLPGRDEALVVWADAEGFSPKSALERGLLSEPETSYVVAAALKWRFVPRCPPAAAVELPS